MTGSSGFIGAELVKHWEGKYDIVTYDITDGQDIADMQQVKESMDGCDVVVHLAAHRKPYEAKTFEDYFENNCIGTFNVAQAASELGIEKLIYTSSTGYYGIEKGIPFQRPVNENNLVLAQHVKVDDLSCRDCDISYSTSKVIGEQVLANYGLTKKMQVIMLRLGPTRQKGVYKPFGDLGLHLKIENALQVFDKVIECKEKLWYEAFTIVDDNIDDVSIEKARKMIGYNPE
jgi:nucleoside-diphosphate-sugar epimerase